MGMIQTIKKAGVEAINASNPLNIEFGVILDSKNLSIRVEQKKILSKEFFIVPESLQKYELDLKHNHNASNNTTSRNLGKIIIREGFKNGDKVILLRIKQGTQYLILDKVV